MKRNEPLCPFCGVEMDLIQLAATGYRYGCTKCATTAKGSAPRSRGWLSPIRSTKELAKDAALCSVSGKLATLEEVEKGGAFWLERYIGVYRTPDGQQIARFSLTPVLVCDQQESDAHVMFLHSDGFKHGLTKRSHRIEWRCWTTEPTEKECDSEAWG